MIKMLYEKSALAPMPLFLVYHGPMLEKKLDRIDVLSTPHKAFFGIRTNKKKFLKENYPIGWFLFLNLLNDEKKITKLTSQIDFFAIS